MPRMSVSKKSWSWLFFISYLTGPDDDDNVAPVKDAKAPANAYCAICMIELPWG